MTIFISYRRADTPDVSGRIYDELARHFGADAVFKDVDDIPLGVHFGDFLQGIVQQCSVMLVVIGADWVDATDDRGRRRLDQPDDFVRIEVAAALERGIPVIPLLVRGASIPGQSELPEELASLSYHNGIRIRPDPDFHKDMARLIRQIEPRVQPPGKVRAIRQTPKSREIRPQAPPILTPGPGEKTQTSGKTFVEFGDRWWCLLWVLAYVLVSVLDGLYTSGIYSLIGALVTGTMMGFAHWALMRQRIHVPAWWIPATVAGWLVGAILWGSVPLGLGSSRLTVTGVVVGAIQWLFLRRYVRSAGWWWGASVAGWLISAMPAYLLLGGGTYEIPDRLLPLTWIVSVSTGGALSGALTAAVLVLLARRPRTEP